MTDENANRAALAELNRNYVRSVDEADVAWFDANLATDFMNTRRSISISSVLRCFELNELRRSFVAVG